MANHYRTIVPNGTGGGTTYRDHIVNPTTRDDAYAVAARIPGAYVEVSPNGVTGWDDDVEDVYTVTTTAGARLGYPAHAIRDTRAEAIDVANHLHAHRVANGAEGVDAVRVEHGGEVIWAIRDNGTIIS